MICDQALYEYSSKLPIHHIKEGLDVRLLSITCHPLCSTPTEVVTPVYISNSQIQQDRVSQILWILAST